MRIKEYLLLLTKPELELLIDLCNFSEEESEILTMLSKNNSLIEISENTKLSVSTVKRRTLKIRKKVERMVKVTIDGKEVKDISEIKLSEDTIRMIRTSVQN